MIPLPKISKLPKPKRESSAIGGHARSASLTPDRRSEIAKQAATARWADAAKLPKPRVRKIVAFIPYEHDIQAAFIVWCRYAEKTMPLLMLGFAVPNGGKRSKKTAAMMKVEGQRSGVPDWMLPVPCGGFTGLAIELKRPGQTTSEAQDNYIEMLVAVGWFVVVCTTHTAAADTVKSYLKLGYSGIKT